MTEPPRTADRGVPVVHLHIGTMKSGTSYIQGMLARHRDLLADDGVLYPGARWTEQVEAVRDALAGAGALQRNVPEGSWQKMVDDILAWPGRSVIISMELLSLARPERIQAIVASLAPAEVHATITARDLARVIPSAWQESTQNRQTWTWPDYVAALVGDTAPEPLAHKRFWHQHDLPAIAAEWAERVGWDHVHIVTVPGTSAPRDELWRRFCSAVGLVADTYDGADTVRGNPAVGAASAEFLRRLNAELGDLDVTVYDRVVKRFLAKNRLAHRSGEARLRLPDVYWDWTLDRARAMVGELQRSGVHVIGDLQDLVPVRSVDQPPSSTIEPEPASRAVEDAPTVRAADIAEREVAEAGVHAVAALVLRLAETGSRPRRGGNRT